MVIAIIGVLASIVLVSYSGYADKARIAKTPSWAGSINHSLGDRAVGVWSFDNINGATVYDDSGNNNTGTAYGSPAVADGVVGKALQFDGVNDYVDAGNPASLQITGSLSIATWIKTTDTSGRIIGKYEATDSKIAYVFNVSGVPYLGVSDNGNNLSYRLLSGNALDNQWHHIVGVFNASAQTISMYLDGVLSQGTLGGTIPASIYNCAGNVKMGYDYGGNGYLNGLIDDARIFSAALTQAQIQQYYAAGLPTHQNLATR